VDLQRSPRSSSLEEDAPGLLLAHPVGTRVLVLKHLSAATVLTLLAGRMIAYL
jgi:hypothetical protein